MNAATTTAPAVTPLVVDTGAGYQIPDAAEIATFKADKCSQLMDELVQHGIAAEPIAGFAKMSVPDKREALVGLLKSLGGEAETPPPETAAQPEIAEKPAETKAEAAVSDAAKPKEKVDKSKVKAEPKAGTKKFGGNSPTGAAKVADGDDPVIKFAHRIENVSDRAELEAMAREIQEDSEAAEFKMGGVLARLQSNPAWFKEVGFENFADYVQTQMGIGYRKAMHQIEIYKKLLELDVSWSEFAGIGWTKVLKLLPVVTKQNVAEWVEKAKAMNALSLQNHVDAALKPDTAKNNGEPSEVKTKTFKLHPDQLEIVGAALQKAKKEGNTEVDSVALELMSQSYMGQGSAYTTIEAALAAERKKAGTVEAFLEKVVPLLEAQCAGYVLNLEVNEVTDETKTDAA